MQMRYSPPLACFVLLTVSTAFAKDVETAPNESVLPSVTAQPSANSVVSEQNAVPSPAPTNPGPTDPEPPPAAIDQTPWDYSPYRVKIWIASNNESTSASQLSQPLLEFLDRLFAAAWRTSVSDSPAAVRSAIDRGFSAIDYETVASADPVLAVKRDHIDAPRIRFAADAAKYVKKCVTTADRLAEVSRRGKTNGNPTLDGLDKILSTVDGDSLAVSAAWKDSSVEAVLLSRGMAAALTSPVAKIIRLPIGNLVTEEIQAHDKIFIVSIDSNSTPLRVEVVELDCLMRHFSPVVSSQALDFTSLPAVVGQAVIEAFAPVVRIEDAGQKTAVGLVRAAGLITEKDNPVLIDTGAFLLPLIRKDDRNGNPSAIGKIPWCFLHVKKVAGTRVDMEMYAGRAGGLQGRKNNRTFKWALKTRPVGPGSTIRLHAAGSVNEPLVGYEIYEKKLDGIEMTLVGRTDWDGRILVNKTDAAMRLLYVKNGGAVLARLPIVPGLTSIEVADLLGDDQRLRAEAYVRGTQNAIVDLVAIRTLLAARIRLRLEKGQMTEAKELLQALKDQPTYENIAADMGKKIVQIKGRNSIEQRKIDGLFALTRDMLVKNINSKLLRDLEVDVAAAEATIAKGGVWKRKSKEDDAASSTPTPDAKASAPKAAAPTARDGTRLLPPLHHLRQQPTPSSTVLV